MLFLKWNKWNAKEKKNDDDPDSEEDIEPVDVLLQFIPYYGQGDPSNDRFNYLNIIIL